MSGVLGGGTLYLPYVAYYFFVHGVDPTYFTPILGTPWLPAIAVVMLLADMYREKRATFTSLCFLEHPQRRGQLRSQDVR